MPSSKGEKRVHSLDLPLLHEELSDVESQLASLNRRREEVVTSMAELLEAKIGENVRLGGTAYAWQHETTDWVVFTKPTVLTFGEYQLLRAGGSRGSANEPSSFYVVVQVPQGIDGHKKIVLLSDHGDGIGFSPSA